jgi:hypothetical protein
MSTRRAKQLLYGVFYLVILALIVAAGYGIFRLVSPAAPVTPPCTSNCMPVGANSIATSSVQAFVTSPGRYTFLEQIANTNENYAAQYFDYSIDFYNASGKIIQSVPGSSFIYANQTKYLVVPNQTVADPGVATGFTIKNVYWVSGYARRPAAVQRAKPADQHDVRHGLREWPDNEHRHRRIPIRFCRRHF